MTKVSPHNKGKRLLLPISNAGQPGIHPEQSECGPEPPIILGHGSGEVGDEPVKPDKPSGSSEEKVA